MTIPEQIKKLYNYNSAAKLKKLFTDLYNSISKPSASIAKITPTTNLPSVAATYADLAAARASVDAQRTAVEARLDAIETKLDEIITKLKASGVISE
jgi:hypothetical protein|nr:MAG TPA: phosphoprotein [Caudoviricetes sp.]